MQFRVAPYVVRKGRIFYACIANIAFMAYTMLFVAAAQDKYSGLTAISKAVKIKIYKVIVKPVVVYGSETWTITEMDREKPSTGVRKTLGMIWRHSRK